MRDAWLLLAWLLFLLELQPVVAKTSSSPVAAKNSTYTQEEWSEPVVAANSTYTQEEWADSDSCSEGGVPPTTVNTCTTGAACCLFRASDGETTSSIISGTCANLTFTMFYKTTDCTGPFSTSTQDEAAQAAKGCVNDALFHSRKVTCTDN